MMKKPSINETDGLMSTIIGKDTTITGTVDVKGALRIDGTVKGKVICSDCVTVGTTGMVEAEIESDSTIVAGRMNGNVKAASSIELQAKCEMNGDLKTKALVIEQGAVFCGACSMKDTNSNLGFLPPEEKTGKSEKHHGKEKELTK